ncbi:hypothetical protein [Streptomyces sp. NPDC048611]|uniref:hypothetical protein n=1 Tax=Streptomyces sp. NPDC048611 TaxID=3155635 RepID=UPI00341BB0C5
MPGPEAAGSIPPPPTPNPAPAPEAGANVIDLHTRALARTPSRQDATMTTEPPTDPLLERLAIKAEALYAVHERTLTDPATADAYRIALDLALLLLDGTLAQGHITRDGYQRLHNTLSAAQQAPDCL